MSSWSRCSESHLDCTMSAVHDIDQMMLEPRAKPTFLKFGAVRGGRGGGFSDLVARILC